jgi:hypothetical protein
MRHPRIPRGVGYWGVARGDGSLYNRLPRPQALVRPGWHAGELSLIAAYLCNGRPAGYWCGLAHCRFEGCDQSLGSSDLTDGQWIWPDGLEHYLLEHAVCLPEEFISHMSARGWRVPPGAEDDVTLEGEDFFLPFGDLALWVEWAEALASGDSA